MRTPASKNPPQNGRGSISSSYILMVHYLIERCLLLHMDRDATVKALAKHAHIQPAITTTVWKELVKANREFFAQYFKTIEARGCRLFRRPVESSSSRSSSPIPESSSNSSVVSVRASSQ